MGCRQMLKKRQILDFTPRGRGMGNTRIRNPTAWEVKCTDLLHGYRKHGFERYTMSL